MAIPLKAVKYANLKLRNLKSDLVGVFVGGTAGIGEFTLTAFARHAVRPRIYLVGRNETSASRITQAVKVLNADATVHFIKADTSLLRNVDVACKEIASLESKVNILFMSAGYLTLKGRDETVEGLDKKLCMNYYSRMRFVQNLLPQLTTAAQEPEAVSKVVSILAAGTEGSIIEDDLELKHNWSMLKCSSHAVVMTDLAFETLAKKYTGTAFLHIYPGYVQTGIMDNQGIALKVVSVLAKILFAWMAVPQEECGERNIMYATDPAIYTPRKSERDEIRAELGDMKGNGFYLLNWNGKPTGVKNVLRPLRARNVGEKVWSHTLEVFERILGGSGP